MFLSPGKQYAPDADACYKPVGQEDSVSWNGFGFGSYSNESNLAYDDGNNNVDGISNTTNVNPANTELLFEEDIESATGGCTGMSPKDGDYLQDMGFWKTQQNAINSWGYDLEQANITRHNTKSSYLFCDCDAKARTLDKDGYDIAQHPSDNIWFTHDGRSGDAIPAANPIGC